MTYGEEQLEHIEQNERKILDSGERRQFDSGAVRDIQEGKGRCDLLPLDIVGELINVYHIDENKIHSIEGDVNDILKYIYNYIRTGNTGDIINAIGLFIEISEFNTIPMAILEVSKHYEEGAKKYAERNWEKGISAHCYVDSGVRHLLKWLDGWDDEPHDRAFIWNMLGLLWTVKHRPECNDLPYALSQKEASEAEDKEWGSVEERLDLLE